MERKRSLWTDLYEPPRYPALESSLTCDVCVVGGGLAGVTVAYLLARAGRSVVLLEGREIGGGETGKTTAHLAFALDDRFTNLESTFGLDNAHLAANSHKDAITFIESTVLSEDIHCHFQRLDGFLIASTPEDVDLLDKEHDAARRAGLDVERVVTPPMNTFPWELALRFKDQAQFSPLLYLYGLASKVGARGGRIFTNSKVVKFDETARKVFTQSGHTVQASHLVVCTNTPVNDRLTMHTKQAPYRTYAVGFRVKRDAIAKALYWDTADPYHYVRLAESKDPDFETLIVGGEDHKTGQATQYDQYERLEQWTREKFPSVEAVTHRWSGQVLEPVDSLAFIGRNPLSENVYIVTGDSGHGMTHTTLGGKIISELILNGHSEYQNLYDPSRKPVHSLKEFAKENLNVARQYTDWVTPAKKELTDLTPESGTVITEGVKKVACYMDSEGTVHKRSAVCPHLGCIVNWNAEACSWDCPCHGSRFTPLGEAVNGPALSNLEEAEEGERS